MIRQERGWLPQARRAAFEVYRRDAVSKWVEASGGSMRPLIEPGSWMLVEFGAAPVAVGEIVLFARDDLIVAHRLVARRAAGDQLIAKGDAEPYADLPFGPADVLGVVREIRRGVAGPTTRVGCAGRSARAIAWISWWCGRGAAAARRLTSFFSDPLRRVALRAIPPFARVAAQVLYAPFCWAARIHGSRPESGERG